VVVAVLAVIQVLLTKTRAAAAAVQFCKQQSIYLLQLMQLILVQAVRQAQHLSQAKTDLLQVLARFITRSGEVVEVTETETQLAA
jgi:septum formation topological specificity factor MinE